MVLTRRRYLQRAAAGCSIGAGVLGAGCSLGGHHDADVVVDNGSSGPQQVSLVITRVEGDEQIQRSTRLEPGERVTYEGLLATPRGDVRTYRVEVSVEDGAEETTTVSLGDEYGFHRLEVQVVDSGTVRFEPQVH